MPNIRIILSVCLCAILFTACDNGEYIPDPEELNLKVTAMYRKINDVYRNEATLNYTPDGTLTDALKEVWVKASGGGDSLAYTGKYVFERDTALAVTQVKEQRMLVTGTDTTWTDYALFSAEYSGGHIIRLTSTKPAKEVHYVWTGGLLTRIACHNDTVTYTYEAGNYAGKNITLADNDTVKQYYKDSVGFDKLNIGLFSLLPEEYLLVTGMENVTAVNFSKNALLGQKIARILEKYNKDTGEKELEEIESSATAYTISYDSGRKYPNQLITTTTYNYKLTDWLNPENNREEKDKITGSEEYLITVGNFIGN